MTDDFFVFGVLHVLRDGSRELSFPSFFAPRSLARSLIALKKFTRITRNKSIHLTMCVTNTTVPRPQPVALNPSQVHVCQSALSKRLLSNFAPQGIAAEAPVFPISTVSTQSYACAPPQPKPRPKRRRKPQKPGKTAKNNERHFVVHNYHDHSHDPDVDPDLDVNGEHHRRRGGVSIAFPIKLHAVLDQVEADGLSHVISWQSHGRCFLIHDPKEFVEHVMPK